MFFTIRNKCNLPIQRLPFTQRINQKQPKQNVYSDHYRIRTLCAPTCSISQIAASTLHSSMVQHASKEKGNRKKEKEKEKEKEFFFFFFFFHLSLRQQHNRVMSFPLPTTLPRHCPSSIVVRPLMLRLAVKCKCFHTCRNPAILLDSLAGYPLSADPPLFQ